MQPESVNCVLRDASLLCMLVQQIDTRTVRHRGCCVSWPLACRTRPGDWVLDAEHASEHSPSSLALEVSTDCTRPADPLPHIVGRQRLPSSQSHAFILPLHTALSSKIPRLPCWGATSLLRVCRDSAGFWGVCGACLTRVWHYRWCERSSSNAYGKRCHMGCSWSLRPSTCCGTATTTSSRQSWCPPSMYVLRSVFLS